MDKIPSSLHSITLHEDLKTLPCSHTAQCPFSWWVMIFALKWQRVAWGILWRRQPYWDLGWEQESHFTPPNCQGKLKHPVIISITWCLLSCILMGEHPFLIREATYIFKSWLKSYTWKYLVKNIVSPGEWGVDNTHRKDQTVSDF